MEKFKCTLSDEGINLEFNNIRLLISYDYLDVTWDKMRELAESQGGLMPTWEQAMLIVEHRDQIDKLLKEAGRKTLSGWCWLNREYSTDLRFAWCVYMNNGYTNYNNKGNTNNVRAVSAFQL